MAKTQDPEIDQIFLSVDPFWTNPQRLALLNAARVAGIECKLVNSTLAAGAAYIYSHLDKLPEEKVSVAEYVERLREKLANSEEAQNKKYPLNNIILVIDIGDYSFKASILQLSQKTIDVISYCQDDTISGSIFTKLLQDYVEHILIEKYNTNPYEKPTLQLQFQNKIESLKKTLSANTSAQFEFPCGNTYKTIIVQRSELEALIADRVNSLVNGIVQLLQISSEYPPATIELVGGTTRIPLIRQKIGELIDPDSGIEIVSNIEADECIAIGCAMINNLSVTNKLPYSIISDSNNVLFASMDTIPTQKLLVTDPGILKIYVNNQIQAEIESNGKQFHLYVDTNGVLRVIGNVKSNIANSMSEETVLNIQEIEASLQKNDLEVEKREEVKNELESMLFDVERFIESQNSSQPKVKKLEEIAKQNRLWFDECKDFKNPVEEYVFRIDRLKKAKAKVMRNADLKNSLKSEILNMEERKIRVQKILHNDPPRNDGGLRKLIENKLVGWENSYLPMKVRIEDESFLDAIDKFMDPLQKELHEIENAVNVLKQKPLVVQERPSRRREDFWQDGDSPQRNMRRNIRPDDLWGFPGF